ncbi:hypothetical protein ACQW02_12900 [Humitalea sp. 24SJ18S-53]|uniref:hypothetical protein n=1 Tax=Humitalea sp. 24SJ18S-53 TaxID=3422307 RepID=UPI003D66C80E
MRSGDRPSAQPETLLTNTQRRVVFALVGAGFAYLLLGLLLPPHGVVFWLAFVFIPPALGATAALFGGDGGRRVDTWLLGSGAPKQAWQPPAATTLPEATRLALQVAVVPVLIGELLRATGATPALLGEHLRTASAMPAREKAAAARLAQAAVAAWNGAADAAARAALARDLPQLVAGLAAGGPAAVQAAEDAARRFARPAGGLP